jgi:ElaB/YqjD/DUF883 family membrane-anchored ribosome-binding protein
VEIAPSAVVHAHELVDEPPTEQQPTALVLREDDIRMRLSMSQDRLGRAMQRLRRATRVVTPAHQIRAHPYEWIAGGIAVGLVIGWLTASQRR